MFTILGSSGFIGSHTLDYLKELGYECYSPPKNDPEIFTRDLGHIIYCIGLTANFRERPMDAVRAHVCELLKIIEKSKYSSLLYLSSTRVYKYSNSSSEADRISVDPNDLDDIYNISKIMGESICMHCGQPNIKIVRISNVCGYKKDSGDFLYSIIREALNTGNILLKTSLDSEKDYICIDDVVRMLTQISLYGNKKIYNVASGINISNEKIERHIAGRLNSRFEVDKNAIKVVFPIIDNSGIKTEFGFEAKPVFRIIDEIIAYYKKEVIAND